MSKLKVLILDIETAPMTAYIWGLKDQYVDVKQIRTDWCVLAWGAKWLGTSASKIIYKDTSCNKDVHYDKNILESLWKLLDEADVVITQNGEKFDCPRLNARFILHGMKPPRPYKHIDTYRLVKKVAAFTSNGLDYLTQKLCTKYKKLSHKRFPGLSLWIECMAGNRLAWAEMKQYNIHDVLSTEELYMKIRAWAPESTPTPFLTDKVSILCKTCGDKGHMTKQGFSIKNKFKYQQWQCQVCGKWATGDKIK
jgi:DNA polymerase elongation subunit (family B)